MKRSLALLVLLLALPASADKPKKGDDAPTRTPIQHYRHEVMEATGAHMGATKAIVKGEVDRPARDILAHATALNETAHIFGELFPEGSGPDAGKTDASPAVWEKPDEFQAANTAFLEATAKLMEAAKRNDMDASKAAFGEVGKSCGGCHKVFKADDH